ncbi:30S ribosomal protein S20 [Caryophanon latum]|uniref:Small ribosomal subunit protein bS20 n=1 Tax=Caryophanon latum TaxID=33977 RepID=A0A1C0Z5D9_9BACL|nr:30S ribosomal protein S20 [Caryophanon latum]OCS94616.1 30S ribosomal protein S20 [Caryophanon latum]
MPNIKSAIKRVKVAEKAQAANAHAKSTMRSTVKKAEQALVAGAENAPQLVAAASKALDKAASKGLIHKNAAARKKSRLATK